MQNRFIVDLGKLSLTDDHKQQINTAIQKAVAGQLATLNLKNHVALYPVNGFLKGPIINGIVAHEISLQEFTKAVESF